jgi:hypothetical protein
MRIGPLVSSIFHTRTLPPSSTFRYARSDELHSQWLCDRYASRGTDEPRANYRGAASALWWPLHLYAERDLGAREVTKALAVRWSTPFFEVAPQTTDDLGFIQSYLAVCDRLEVGPLSAVVCATPQGSEHTSPWLTELKETCERVGIDVTYPDGCYSFVEDDFAPAGEELFDFLRQHLNAHGLFDRAEGAEKFMRLHQAANDRGANLETLDGAFPVELWVDAGLSQFRRILKPF